MARSASATSRFSRSKSRCISVARRSSSIRRWRARSSSDCSVSRATRRRWSTAAATVSASRKPGRASAATAWFLAVSACVRPKRVKASMSAAACCSALTMLFLASRQARKAKMASACRISAERVLYRCAWRDWRFKPSSCESICFNTSSTRVRLSSAALRRSSAS